MKTSSYSFVGIRKHFWKEVFYNIQLYQDSIEMTEIKSKSPKYILPLKLSTVIEITGQVSKNNRNFSGFQFKYKDTNKLMNCRSSDIAILMDMVSNQITFLNITMFYQAIEIIGRGSSSSVSVLIDTYSQEQFAVKSIDKEYLQKNDKLQILFENEVKILQELTKYNHQNYFVHLYRVFESKTSYYLILNLMKGKSLTAYYNKIKVSNNKQSDSKLFSSDIIKLIMRRLFSGVSLLHCHRIIHRDLKPDNLLLLEPNNVDTLAIADFGLATYSNVEKYSYPICGTKGYMAPEITHYKDGQIKYDEQIDIYSIGVIFIWLQFFYNPRLTGDIDRHNPKLLKLDSITQNLLNNLLKSNPKERLSAQAALDHPYFQTDETTKKTFQSQYGFENVDCDSIIQHEDLKNYSLPMMKKPQRQI
ncbi:unnamed protein product [Paramecium octaurelia]|uniref:Protein kinase domain-containing protein n=1 Tax=Paramecium octaurelia TaxID=43137 RepID=A0A8S1YDA3_PAROT|nr:unnamed protein product [Paramecium octaurelia]